MKDHTENDLLNRRQEPRLPMNFPSLLMQHGKEIYTTVINLSANGIGFLSAVKVAANEEIRISFERLEAFAMEPVTLMVQVQSCHEIDSEYYIGGYINKSDIEFTTFFKSMALSR
jgi:hypothetical protein